MIGFVKTLARFSIRVPNRLVPILALFILVEGGSTAQPLIRGTAPEINSIDFDGNRTFSDGTLRDVIELRETPSGFSKFLYRSFGEKLGSKPEFFDQSTFDEDRRRLETFYQEEGFYEVRIDASTRLDTSSQRIDLSFSISEGIRSLVDSVAYSGLDPVPPGLRGELLRDPLIRKGMPYQERLIAGEIRRILNKLADNGFPMARFDDQGSGKYRRLSTGNFLLVFSFTPGRRYQFGEISVSVDPPREDVRPSLALRQLDFQTGDFFSHEAKVSSERNLNRLGLFETARIDHTPSLDTLESTLIPISVAVRPRVRNELAPEVFVSSAEETGEFSLGIGLGFTHRNFLGDARTFDVRGRVRTQSLGRLFRGIALRDTIVVGAAELQFRIVQPFLFTRSLSGTWTGAVSADKQKSYLLSILKSRIGLSNQFATYTFGFFDWTLERVSPLLLTAEARLREEDKPQFNSIFSITLQRDKTNEIFSPTDGFFNSISLEESGLLPDLLYGNDPDPRLPYTQYYKVTLFGRWYRDLSDSRFSIFATKLKAGYQDKYGESRNRAVNIPLNRRFFAGGSASVRGWRARELGAMPDERVPFGGNVSFEGSLELRVSHFRDFGKVWFIRFENIWGVYFLDFGNIWSGLSDVRPRDVAVAAGLGFRYETFFGPFRIDYGVRAYDPKEEAGRQTIFQRRFFAETLSNGVFHFGIGHAF